MARKTAGATIALAALGDQLLVLLGKPLVAVQFLLDGMSAFQTATVMDSLAALAVGSEANYVGVSC